MSSARNILFKKPAGIWEKLCNKKLLIAFSGGKDSLALLDYANSYKKSYGFDIVACHINHHLRGRESLRDENFCKQWCLDRNIDCVSVAIQVLSGDLSRGVEYAAREARYKILKEKCKEFSCDYILTAHTLDDQIESFFVDILTGASVYTIGGIPEITENIVRPFLDVTTEMIHEYLLNKGLTPVYDSSNSDINYVRNSVRNMLFPALLDERAGFDLHAMQNSIHRMQAESREVEQFMDKTTSECVIIVQEGAIIDRKKFDALEICQKRYIIGKWVSILCRGGKIHIDAVLNLVKRNKSTRIDLPQKYCCEVTPKSIRVYPKNLIEHYQVIKNAGVEHVFLLDGRKVIFAEELVPYELIVRKRKDGDRYKGELLKTLFSDKKVELYFRDRAVIVEQKGKIIWVQYLNISSDLVEVVSGNVND